MASNGWVLLPLTLFLFPLLIESRSPPSAPPHHPHHHHQPFEFIKNLEGCHKGETVKGIHKLKQYLEHFGYLPRHSTNTTNTNSHKNVGTDNDSFDEQLELAIKSYQRNYHLNVTGELDVETAEQMMKPRCGVADIINGKSSMRSGKGRHLYTFFPNSPRWPSSKTRLTYGFLQGVQVISLQNHRTICKSAFDKWSAVSHFTFEEAQNVASADIKIGFFSRGHGDNAPFDGAGGVLAHAFAPTRGWFHYDADENWAINPTANAFDVESVAVHEIGHLLGLGHSQDRNAIMFPSIGRGQKKRQRSIEDEHDEVDKEYRPPGPNEEELNSSDEEDEYTHMAPGRRRQCSAGTQESVPDRTSSQHEIVASQPNLSSPPTTDSSVASSSRRVRGRVVGHESEKRMRILGSRISVPLGAASGAFEGEYASTFAIELGSHIRRLVPLNKETWAAIDDGCKEAIFTAAAQKYDFGDWKTDACVAIAVGKLAMHTYREFRAELHKAYKKLLEKGHDPKQYPYDTQRAAQGAIKISAVTPSTSKDNSDSLVEANASNMHALDDTPFLKSLQSYC
ncbi:hypothetical protein MRB53_014943 [Persea americana]|uniref:Uncharacterized protein n=1 Tax=Persea americana TaxID=3435 RepID=A0ACC2KCK1_PERAE|nr:hypothetical protein MRB53_014943 [Persea americana]